MTSKLSLANSSSDGNDTYEDHNYPMKYVITGPACMFKTTILKALGKQGVKVVVGDYFEHCTEQPIFKQKATDPNLDLEYQAYVMGVMRYGHIHDRWPVDNIFYRVIFDVLNNCITEEEAHARLSGACIRSIRRLSHEYKVFLLMPENVEELAERMKRRRQDALDDLGVSYAGIQTRLYDLVGTLCGWERFVLGTYERDVPALIKRIIAITNSYQPRNITTTAAPAVVKYTTIDPENHILTAGDCYAAGKDLPAAADMIIYPNQSVLVPTGIKIELPDHLYATINARSSTFFKNLYINRGIIDTNYRGELMIQVRNGGEAPYHIHRGECIAQLVIHQMIDTRCVVVSELSPTRRGAKGFGSTTDEQIKTYE